MHLPLKTVDNCLCLSGAKNTLPGGERLKKGKLNTWSFQALLMSSSSNSTAAPGT